MRKLVWVALAFLLVLLLIFSLAPPEEKPAEKPDGAHFSFGAYSWKAAQMGGQPVVVAQGFLHGEKNGTLYGWCPERGVQKSALILLHPDVPGIDSSLREKIALALSSEGLAARQAPLSEAALAKNALIIAPTGALPCALEGREGEIAGRNSRVVVLESLSGRKICHDGSIGNANASAYESVRLEPGDDEGAVFKIAKLSVLPKVVGGGVAIGEGNFTAVIPLSKNSTVGCRLVFENGRRLRFSDSPPLSLPQGRLAGPKNTLAGRRAVFEFSLEGDGGGQMLDFYAEYAVGKARVREKIAGGRAVSGFASAFALVFNQSGGYGVDVVDQFGRAHASAYLEVEGLSAKPLGRSGNRYDFYLSLGGKGAEGAVLVGLGNGTQKEFYASNGTLSVFAEPKPGEHILRFSYGGAEAALPVEFLGEGFLASYLRLLAPALLFLAAVFLLFGARGRAKYRITFPQEAQGAGRAVQASRGDFAEAWREADSRNGGHCLPCYPHEIALALARKKGAGEGIGEGSVWEALVRLEEQGAFCSSEGAFIPKGRCGKFSIGELWVLRTIHDLLLEHGMGFAKKPCVPMGNGIEACLFRGKGSVLCGIGKRVRVVVFKSALEKDEFACGLGSGAGDEEIKLALSLGKLYFATAARREIGKYVV